MSEDRKVALVTGATRGIGQAIAAELAGAGWFVVGTATSEKGAAVISEALGEQGAGVVLNVADDDSVAEGLKALSAEYGPPLVLVNNAGTCFMSEFPDIPPAEFEKQMSLNFSAAFHCCQAAVKLMQGRDGVRKIVNISSNGAYNFDVFDPPHYRASKAALDTLTKDLARRFARDKISVNSIAPAMTETPLFNVVSKEVLDAAIAQMPHGRPMQPAEVAEWVRFLASPAGDISSGNVIILNQGRDVR